MSRARILLAFAFVVPACTTHTCPDVVVPTNAQAGPPQTTAPAGTLEQAVANTPDITAAVSFEPSPTTPAGVREQFGKLVGVWMCKGESRQPDGTFKPGPGESRWTFFYTLGGQAIGDVFEPPQGSGGPVGINLRVYRPETNDWVLSWTTPALQRYDHYEAKQVGETLVMRGEIAANAPFPQYSAKITFSQMTRASFSWQLEAAKPGSDGPWQVFSKIECRAAV